jgi:hypothetical protein
MSARVTAAEVKAIMPVNNPPSDSVINSFITGATNLVDNVLGSDTTLSDDLKKEIERWLTAHLISITLKRMASEEGAGGANIKYAGEWGRGLSSSPYGQTVLVLDSTGKMATLDSKGAKIIAITSFED